MCPWHAISGVTRNWTHPQCAGQENSSDWSLDSQCLTLWIKLQAHLNSDTTNNVQPNECTTQNHYQTLTERVVHQPQLSGHWCWLYPTPIDCSAKVGHVISNALFWLALLITTANHCCSIAFKCRPTAATAWIQSGRDAGRVDPRVWRNMHLKLPAGHMGCVCLKSTPVTTSKTTPNFHIRWLD